MPHRCAPAFLRLLGGINGLQPHLVLARVYVQNHYGVAVSDRDNFADQLLDLSRNGSESERGAHQQTPFQ